MNTTKQFHDATTANRFGQIVLATTIALVALCGLAFTTFWAAFQLGSLHPVLGIAWASAGASSLASAITSRIETTTAADNSEVAFRAWIANKAVRNTRTSGTAMLVWSAGIVDAVLIDLGILP